MSDMRKTNTLLPYLKALSEGMRLKVIHMLLKREMCVCEVMEELKLSQPAVSHHMKILKQAGLISDRREGKWIFYSLRKERFSVLEKLLRENLFEPVKESHGEKGNIPLGKCS
jgi:ArsR family transcriptional regulator, arsenate/arsenite/antimonite-responsive transcriptional repressor